MIKKESSFELRNPKKRDLSPFMAEQFLYDYVTKKLDPKREKAVKEALESSPVLAKALDDIIYGMTYCHHLQKTSLSQELLSKLNAPQNWKSKAKQFLNPRSWNKSLPWAFEAVTISLIVFILSYSIPWLKLITLVKEKTKHRLLISEIPKDTTYNSLTESSKTGPEIFAKEYHSVAELRAVNPDFTANKLGAALPRLGASIEHHSLKKSSHGIITPFFRISIPRNQTEALLAELKTQGQLTWITPPSENENGSIIFGMELWLIQQEPRKVKAPSKDSIEE